MRKLISLVLAAVMIAAMALPAMAGVKYTDHEDPAVVAAGIRNGEFTAIVYDSNSGVIVSVTEPSTGGSGGAAWGSGVTANKATYIGSLSPWRQVNNGIPFGATFVPVPVIKKLLDVSLTYAAGAGNAITYAENPFEGTAEINVDGTNKLFYGTSNEYVKYGAAVGTALKLGTAGVNARWIPYGSGLALGVPLRATIEGIGGHVIWGGAVTTIYIPKTVKPLVVAPTATVAPLGSGAGFQAVSQERANYDLFTFTGSITGLTFLSDITRDKALDTASQAKLTAAEKVQTYIAFEYLSTDGRTWIRVPISPGGSFTLTGVANDLVYFYYQ